MVRRSSDDPLMMREDFEILAPRDCDEGDPAGFGKTYPGRRRGGHGGDDRRPEPRRLLDKFDRDPAGQQHDAMCGHVPTPDERANELIECIVAPDVLPEGAPESKSQRRERHGFDHSAFVRPKGKPWPRRSPWNRNGSR